jgi:hypothetical protein
MMTRSTSVNRQSLIDTIDQIFRDYDANCADYQAAEQRYHAAHLAEWLAEYKPKLKRLRDLLSENAKSKTKPLTSEEVNAIFGKTYIPTYSPPGSTNFHFEGERYSPPFISQPGELRALRATLAALEDATITPNLLRTLGFKELGWVYRSAVNNAREES